VTSRRLSASLRSRSLELRSSRGRGMVIAPSHRNVGRAAPQVWQRRTNVCREVTSPARGPSYIDVSPTGSATREGPLAQPRVAFCECGMSHGAPRNFGREAPEGLKRNNSTIARCGG
jgi:hypothetical protein